MQKKYEGQIDTLKGDLEKKTKDHHKNMKKQEADFESDLSQMDSEYKQQLNDMSKELTDEQDEMDEETRNLFKNTSTLKFVKDMRFFKQKWAQEKTVKKRKKIAAAMANATKAWVGDGEEMD